MNKEIEMLKKANLLDKKGKIKDADSLEKQAQSLFGPDSEWYKKRIQRKNQIEKERQRKLQEENKKFFELGTRKYGPGPSNQQLQERLEESIKYSPLFPPLSKEEIAKRNYYNQKKKLIADQTYYLHDKNRTWWDNIEKRLFPSQYSERTLKEE